MKQHTWKLAYQVSQRDDHKLASNPKNSGFTLLEILVAVFMIGILSAIAAPSWLGFMNRQRLNKANEIVLAAIQEAQREAKKDKQDYSVSVRTNSGVPEIAVYSGSTSTNWQNLTEKLDIKSGEIIVGTNLNTPNTLASPADVAFNNLSTEKTITFDHMGALGSNSDTGIKIVVAIPQSTNSTTPSNNKRCVIVETLIGGMRTAKDDDCK